MAVAFIVKILLVALPGVCVAALGSAAPRRGVVWTIVAGLSLYQILLLCIPLTLGHLSVLSSATMRATLGAASAVLLWMALRGTVPLFRTACAALRWHPRLIDAPLGAAALLVFAFFAIQVVSDWTVGAGQFDALVYHIPRALLWSWHGGFEPWRTAEWTQVGLPVGGDAMLLPGVLAGVGWLGAAWTSMCLSAGAAVAVFDTVRFQGSDRRSALIAALAFLSFPAVGLRLIDVSTDIAAAFPLLAAWVLVHRAASLREAMLVLPVLLGAGIACKPTVAFVGALLAAVILFPRLPALVRDRQALAFLLLGTILAGLLCLGSFAPVYWLFGDFMGGPNGRVSSAFAHGGWSGVLRSTVFGTAHWIVEPFCVLPEAQRDEVLDRLGVGRVYKALGAGTRSRWYPAMNRETNASGLIPVLALPWLLAALPPGRRLLAGGMFVGGLVAQFGPFKINEFGSRFMVPLLAGFAILWGVRARFSPRLVLALLVAALVVDLPSISRYWGAVREGWNRPEPNAAIAARVGNETLLVLTQVFSTEAQHSGRRHPIRFEYLSCPPNGDWPGLFRAARQRSRWILMYMNDSLRPGPDYESRLGPPCPPVPAAHVTRALLEAGWQKVLEERGYQLWSFSGYSTPAGR